MPTISFWPNVWQCVKWSTVFHRLSESPDNLGRFGRNIILFFSPGDSDNDRITGVKSEKIRTLRRGGVGKAGRTSQFLNSEQ
jgi:hypothetical protein